MPKLHVDITEQQKETFSKVAKFTGRTKGSLQTEWITQALAKFEAKMIKASSIDLGTTLNE